MGLDLRIPLGLMFLSIGALMCGYGALTWHSPIYAQSLGQNINVLWGSVMLIFGGLMFFLGRRARWQEGSTDGTVGRPDTAVDASPRRH
ncbi:hypothetical protein Terro_2494 [Terriglobus roseus DSM 18391]|uniref:Uncharacterized protein n=1 Tax=Terriglobus roseus (strain DSM 18391 / NRRL B-41598 / KBS 63) TaxID=926566 RepID=I3ZHM4_TERRK|nr:hypothetical protein [Terriglobus roseus]AFL88401.1 hypothetical protein Terro_2130 [Terriglobus roseus DSM 18391]AFL88742.1 hypothetical protein Terro_2494 [Terriglobus roseus DSM 18391]